MFREMRRFAQQLPDKVSKEILETANTGILSVSGDDGYPYGVPVNFAYVDGKIYIHCALTGHKLDGIRRNSKVSFCVIAADDVHLDEYTTYYRSVIAFGKARVLETMVEKIAAMQKIMAKYPAPFSEDVVQSKIESSVSRFAIVEIEIEHCTGKENSKLSAMRKK